MNETTFGKVERTKELLDDYLWIYVSPIILVLGLTGNGMTLAVMCRKCLRGSTTSVYMPVMAVFDTIALTSGIIPEWSDACGFVTFNSLHPFTCKLEKFTFYTTSDTAIWILVLFTFDRFIAVCFPLRKRSICVPRRAKIACFCAFLCAVLKNFHVFFTRGAVYNEDGSVVKNCGKPEAFAHFESHIRPYLAMVLISVVPFCLMLCFNCKIIWTLTQMKSVHALVDPTKHGKGNAFRQTTMMCMSASFAFLICIIPSMVMLIGKPYWTVTPNQVYNVAKAINNQLAYLNHSINFFLYCITGKKFRTELVSMFREGKRRMSNLDDMSVSAVGNNIYRKRLSSTAPVTRTTYHARDSTAANVAYHGDDTLALEPLTPVNESTDSQNLDLKS